MSFLVALGSAVMLSQLVVRVRERARIARGIHAHGFYAKALKPGDLAFDVGANLGDHTVAMLAAGARVVALEPQHALARDLAARCPQATVLGVGAADQDGHAKLLTSSDHHELSTLVPGWADAHEGYATWDGEEEVALTTLDALIEEYGVPAFVKVDTEGFEAKVLKGLSRPVGQLMFEVHAAMPDVAQRSFERLAELGSYEFRVMVRQSWMFGPTVSASEVLADMPDYGDVHARLISS